MSKLTIFHWTDVVFQTILEVVLPRYLEHLKKETNQRDNPPAARAEINTINDIGTSLKAVLTSCEFFTRSVLRLSRIFPKKFGHGRFTTLLDCSSLCYF